MAKFALFPVLLVAACLAAGVYGALHNQVSYTVSPEYFHSYKFYQFGIPEALRGRIGASIVGWYASWWMGLFIGIPLAIVGSILPDWNAYLGHCLRAFAVSAFTALVVGLVALFYATFTIPEGAPDWHRQGIGDASAFGRATTMHEFSYLGGFIGIWTGTLYLIVVRFRRTGYVAEPSPRFTPQVRWLRRRRSPE